MTITATIVTDSISPDGARLTTMKLRYPRFIHAELMTHRAFSRNASSSRAIPVKRLIQDVRDDTAMPIHWGKNQKGMQAREENDAPVEVLIPCKPSGGSDYPGWLNLTPEVLNEGHPVSLEDHEATAAQAWCCARDMAVAMAHRFDQAGYHKQIVNRLLEPFSHINVIVTATDWDNFFQLRLHPDAQPEIQELARQMKFAMAGSRPRETKFGGWHIPFVTHDELDAFSSNKRNLLFISSARCARVSYETHEGAKPNSSEDLDLAHRLLGSQHMSPFEHQGMAYGLASAPYANFHGFKSFRYQMEQGTC